MFVRAHDRQRLAMWKFLNTWKKKLCAFVLALLLPAMVFGAVTYNTAGTSPGASSTTCVITAPTGITIGDLLIASCSFDDGGASSVSLSGWTVVKKTQIGTYTLATLAKIADSGDTSAGTFTFTTTGSSASNVGGMIRLSGTASTVATAIDTVVDSSGGGVARVSNASSNTITSTDDIIVMVGGARNDSSWFLGDMTNTQNGSRWTGSRARNKWKLQLHKAMIHPSPSTLPYGMALVPVCRLEI